MKQRCLTITAICMALLFTNSNLYAQALYEVSLDEKVQQSSHILEGTVLEKTSFWNPAHTMIYTSNKVKLHKLFKGTFAAENIEILTQGGTVGNEQLDVSDLANLSVGETGVFFCSPNVLQIKNPETNNVLWDIYSSAQGFIKYDMKTKRADAPFARYENILGKLYPAITQRTGRSFESKDPFFDAGANAAPPQTNHLLGITSFSPASVAAGATANPAPNLLTINGTGFGNATGAAAIL
ncbi:MAG TPA: hypothetical protein VLR49_09680, partial [Ferruginibacter sp.]|nr:hypothetical protein [Ferruginibacter sp.]